MVSMASQKTAQGRRAHVPPEIKAYCLDGINGRPIPFTAGVSSPGKAETLLSLVLCETERTSVLFIIP